MRGNRVRSKKRHNGRVPLHPRQKRGSFESIEPGGRGEEVLIRNFKSKKRGSDQVTLPGKKVGSAKGIRHETNKD